MLRILFTLLLAQGVVVPADSGSISGVLKTAAGTPAVGVRVAAMARPESLQDVTQGAALVSIAESDEAGRFRLENIPPGRYYVTAGRVDLPTFFPGSTDISKGTVVLITPGAKLSGMDFVIAASSELFVTSGWTIPVRFAVEGGGRLPIFSGGNFPALRLTRVSDGVRNEVRMTAYSIAPQDSPLSEYRVTFENLPEGYAVKSMTFGATDLLRETLRISLANFPASNALSLFNGLGTSARTIPSLTDIVVTLTTTSLPPTGGVRVIGQARPAELRSIFLSGKPGTLFSDGTFEFRGVAPGRHILAAIDNSGQFLPLAAYIVVKNQDLQGIQLHETPVLPLNVESPTEPIPTGELGPGVAIQLATLRGGIISDATRQPVASGAVTIFGAGNSRVTYPIANGRYEIPQLLPGNYRLEVSLFDHFTMSRDIVVTGENADVDLSLRRVY